MQEDSRELLYRELWHEAAREADFWRTGFQAADWYANHLRRLLQTKSLPSISILIHELDGYLVNLKDEAPLKGLLSEIRDVLKSISVASGQ